MIYSRGLSTVRCNLILTFIGWSGWNNPGVGDFILPGQSPLPDFTMNGQQQWV